MGLNEFLLDALNRGVSSDEDLLQALKATERELKREAEEEKRQVLYENLRGPRRYIMMK